MTQTALHLEIRRRLAQVEDPELPVSIVDLGLVRDVEVEGARVRVRLVPTFSGCPALDLIRRRVRDAVAAVTGVEAVDVEMTYDEPWTIDRLSEDGRRRLVAHGLSVPRRSFAEPAACPYCGSTNTTFESPFGPTLCRAIYYCRDCRNPIERFKPPADP